MGISYDEALRQNTSPQAMWRGAGIPPRFNEADLLNFHFEDVDEDTDKPWPKLGVFRWACNYACCPKKRRDEGTGAILCGKTGTGKTHIAVGIVKEFLAKGFSARITTVQRAVRSIKNTWTKGSPVSHGDALKVYTEPDLLVLDEVGIQFNSEAERIVLFDMLGERYDWMRPTILVSNLSLEDIEEALGPRVVDRMREGGGKMIVFDWESHRSIEGNNDS